MVMAIGIPFDQTTKIVGKMEIKRVLAFVCDLDVLDPIVAKSLHQIKYFDPNRVLVRTDENGDMERLLRQQQQVLRLDVLVVDQDILDACQRIHGGLDGMLRQSFDQS